MSKWVPISALVILIWAGCKGVPELPEPIGIEPPPVPENLQVEMPSPGVYDLYWSVSDSTAVAFFNIYVYNDFSGASLVDSTRVTNYHYDFNFPLVGVTWGVSAVSEERVESSIVFATAPEQ